MEDIKVTFGVVKNNLNNNSDEYKLLVKQIDEYRVRIANNINKCVMVCNTVISNLANTISKNFPDDQSIGTYSGVIKEVVEKRPLEPISLFLLHVYRNDEYRENILSGNDNFFLSNNHNHLTNSDSEKISIMFQFKNSWSFMSNDMKQYTRQSMITIVKTCEQYIKYKSDSCDIDDICKKINYV